MRWKVLTWGALQLSLYPAMSHVNLSHPLAPLLTLGLSQHCELFWWSLDPWLNWIILPKPRFFFFLPLLCTLRLCPCQWGHCPCLFCPQHISHKTFSEQNQKFIPTFFKDEETKRRIPQSHTKSSTNISQTCSTSRVLLNWSWVHLGFWCQGRVAHTLHQSLLQHGESLDTLAPWARKSSPS